MDASSGSSHVHAPPVDTHVPHHVPHHEPQVHFHDHHVEQDQPHTSSHKPHHPHHPHHGQPGHGNPPDLPITEPPPYYDDPNQTQLNSWQNLRFRQYERSNVWIPTPKFQWFFMLLFFGVFCAILIFIVSSSTGPRNDWPNMPPSFRPNPGHPMFPPSVTLRPEVLPCSKTGGRINLDQTPLPPAVAEEYEDDNNNPSSKDGPEHPIRSITRHQLFGSITGHFDLYDLVDLQTVTGTIDITVTPRPGDKPAVLKVHSATGSVRVRLSDEFMRSASDLTAYGPPYEISGLNDAEIFNSIDRRFDTDIKTFTGSVTVKYLLGGGGRTSVHSQVGHLNLELFTVEIGRDDPITTLSTLTQPGLQSILVKPLSRDGGNISSLHAEHTGQGVGGLDVVYPAEWEGIVETTLQGVGHVDVDGDGLQIVEKQDFYSKARRGEGNSKVQLVWQGTGDITFRC